MSEARKLVDEVKASRAEWENEHWAGYIGPLADTLEATLDELASVTDERDEAIKDASYLIIVFGYLVIDGHCDEKHLPPSVQRRVRDFRASLAQEGAPA